MALIVTCPPEPWPLACVSSSGEMKPIPLSLIKSPFQTFSCSATYYHTLDLLPLLLNSNVMDLKSPTCSAICSLSGNVYILIA